MKKLKVVSVVGTRPEIIRLSRVLNKLDVHCDHVLLHTGQNYDYELNQIFFDDLNVRKPDYFLNCAQESKSAANTIGNLITSVDAVLASELPDAMLEVHHPTLVMWAMDDVALLPELVDGLQVWVPHLTLEKIEGATHWVLHEQPGLIAARLRAFLER